VNSNLVLDHINVILGILAPFMQRMFDSLESEQARVGVREQFDAFASGPHKNLLQKEEGKDLRKEPLHNISFREKFQSVMQPLQSFIYGTDRTLESSQVPRDLKLFLKEMPKIYAAWGEQQDIAAKDLVGMIKSALIGMLFIRGLLPVWNDKFQAELTEQTHSDRAWSKNKEQLSALLGSYTSFLFDDFILAIIATADGKSPALAQYFKSIEKAAELRRKEALVAGKKQEKTKRELTRGATVSNSKSGNSEKRSNFGQFIQGLISPRKKESATSGALPTSPRSTKASERVQSAEGVLLKKTQARPNNVVRTQRRALDQYLKSIKLPNYDPGFIRHLSEAIAKRENYEDFESAPAAFCLLQLDEYVESLNQSGSVAPPALDEIENWLFSLAEAEKTAAKQESEKAKSTQQTNPSGASNVRPSTAIPSIVPRLDLGTLVKSPTADDSSEVDDVADSAKNELADITAADAQHSEGSDVKQKSDESLENEKNQQ
jgi:hypothetical protein